MKATTNRESEGTIGMRRRGSRRRQIWQAAAMSLTAAAVAAAVVRARRASRQQPGEEGAALQAGSFGEATTYPSPAAAGSTEVPRTVAAAR
jgi:hypothetical protein